MKPMVKLGYLAAACTLLVATFSIIGPRAVWAAVATTIRDQDNPARHVYSDLCLFQTTSVAGSCTMTVPAGSELVIEKLSVLASGTAPSNTQLFYELQTTSNSGLDPTFGTAQDIGVNQPAGSAFSTTMSMRQYADPGSTITFYVQTKAPNPASPEFKAFISGYLVSLP